MEKKNILDNTSNNKTTIIIIIIIIATTTTTNTTITTATTKTTNSTTLLHPQISSPKTKSVQKLRVLTLVICLLMELRAKNQSRRV